MTPLQKGYGGDKRIDIPNVPHNNIFAISQNRFLCRYLCKLSSEGNEICLHGVFHKKTKALSENVSPYFEKGIRIVEKICRQEVKTYVPPFGLMSRETIDYVHKKKMNISCSLGQYYPILKNLPIKMFLRNVIKKKGSYIFLSDEYLFGYRLSRYKHPSKCYKHAIKVFNCYHRIKKPLIIINHYWDFFENKNLNSIMIKYWNKFIDYILDFKNVEFATFKDFN